MNSKKLPTNTANMAYEEAYIAMLQGDEDACSTHCDTYYAMVDTLTPVESLLVSMTVDLEECSSNICNPDGILYENLKEECSWFTLEANTVDKAAPPSYQFEDMYQPTPIWQRLPGHTIRGIETFKVS